MTYNIEFAESVEKQLKKIPKKEAARIKEKILLILIVAIGHRKDIYDL